MIHRTTKVIFTVVVLGILSLIQQATYAVDPSTSRSSRPKKIPPIEPCCPGECCPSKEEGEKENPDTPPLDPDNKKHKRKKPKKKGNSYLLVAGFEVQDCWPAHGQGRLHGFTHDAASDEKFCAEMVALS